MTENGPSNENGGDDLRNAELVIVARCPNEAQASIFISVLADDGIRAIATGGFTAGFQAEAPGDVQVKTLKNDAERAKEILSELKPAGGDETPDEISESA